MDKLYKGLSILSIKIEIISEKTIFLVEVTKIISIFVQLDLRFRQEFEILPIPLARSAPHRPTPERTFETPAQ